MRILKRLVVLSLVLVSVIGYYSCDDRNHVKEYYEDGSTLKEEYFTKNTDGGELKHGVYKSFYPSGILKEEINYTEGKMDGMRKLYLEDGTVEVEETYANDQYQGPYISRYADGTVKEEGQYLDGAMNGTWRFYYEDGQIREEVNFSNNMENGPYKRFHENGQLASEGQFKDELEVGHWVYYHPNGNIQEEVDFVDGKEEGLVVVLDEQGDTLKRIVYEKGLPVEFKEYKQDPEEL